jgi:hypothetical protein
MKRALVSLCFSAFALSVASRASATPNFPAAIQQDLGLSSAPDCTLCHNNELGGVGTVTTPFGKNMVERGLIAFSTSSLQTALDAMEAEHVVSAGGCLPDIEELKAGRNPNDPGDTADCDGGTPIGTSGSSSDGAPASGGPEEAALTPTYGCEATVAPGTGPSRRQGDVVETVLLGIVAIVRLRGARGCSTRRKGREAQPDGSSKNWGRGSRRGGGDRPRLGRVRLEPDP